MARRKVVTFKVADIIVSVKCPHCKAQLPSPRYPDSAGWDRKDMKLYGKSKPVVCPKCGAESSLPTKLFELAG